MPRKVAIPYDPLWEKALLRMNMAKAAIKAASRSSDGADMAAEYLEQAAQSLRNYAEEQRRAKKTS